MLGGIEIGTSYYGGEGPFIPEKYTVGLATETDSGLAASFSIITPLGVATETDTAIGASFVLTAPATWRNPKVNQINFTA